MKTLVCKDLNPKSDCTYTTEGATAEEVVKKMMVHAKEVHMEDIMEMKKTMSEAEINDFMISKVKNA